ncbi:hypothetical protein DSO57_1007540 [Entomophthora muscae]|nr:hypothetical protein DSO57_1007540 [Entomophthora muscae]
MMIYLGDPGFYDKYVRGHSAYPPPEKCHKFGSSPEELKRLLEEAKEKMRKQNNAALQSSEENKPE